MCRTYLRVLHRCRRPASHGSASELEEPLETTRRSRSSVHDVQLADRPDLSTQAPAKQGLDGGQRWRSIPCEEARVYSFASNRMVSLKTPGQGNEKLNAARRTAVRRFLIRQSLRLEDGHDHRTHVTSDFGSRASTRDGRRDTLRFKTLSRPRSSTFLIPIATAALAAAVRISVRAVRLPAPRSGFSTIRDKPSRTWWALASRPRCGRARRVPNHLNPKAAATAAGPVSNTPSACLLTCSLTSRASCRRRSSSATSRARSSRSVTISPLSCRTVSCGEICSLEPLSIAVSVMPAAPSPIGRSH